MRPDSSGLETFRSLFLNQTKRPALKRLEFSRKPLETESLSEVQFVIDSCRLVTESNYLNNSNKDCDWLILACFIREQRPLLLILKIKFGFKILAECVRIYRGYYTVARRYEFMFEWQKQYLTSQRSERVRYCSCHKNIKFISSG